MWWTVRMSAAQAKKPVMIWQVTVSRNSWSSRRMAGLAVVEASVVVNWVVALSVVKPSVDAGLIVLARFIVRLGSLVG